MNAITDYVKRGLEYEGSEMEFIDLPEIEGWYAPSKSESLVAAAVMFGAVIVVAVLLIALS